MKLFSSMVFPALLIGCASAFAQGIVNGNFDLGRSQGWTEYSQGKYTLIGTAALFASTEITPPVIPRSGQFMGRIGGFSYEVNSISQTVTLPKTTPLYLKVYVQDRNSTTSECAGLWVGAQIRTYVAGQKIFDTYLCHYSQSETWTPVYFDLSAAAGQTVQIIFQADAANSVWSFLYIDDVSLTNQITAVDKEPNLLPANFSLSQNYPNPFNPSTTIQFALPRKEYVSLKIFNITGEEVATLVNEELPAGTYNKVWNAVKNASGVFFFRLQAGNFIETRKLIFIK